MLLKGAHRQHRGLIQTPRFNFNRVPQSFVIEIRNYAGRHAAQSSRFSEIFANGKIAQNCAGILAVLAVIGDVSRTGFCPRNSICQSPPYKRFSLRLIFTLNMSRYCVSAERRRSRQREAKRER
jgi:hypothetical protein